MNDNISVDKNTKKFEIFWKRFSDEYPIAYDSVINHYKKISSAWKKISPFYGKSMSGTFSIDEDGELTGNMPFWISIGLISEDIIQFITEHTLNENELNAFKKKIVKEAKKVATKTAEEISSHLMFEPEINPIECRECGHLNPYDSIYCNKCGKRLNNR